jgi:hypothetical protein
MKIPTVKGVGVVKGDQVVGRHCYNTPLKSLLEKTSLGEKSKYENYRTSNLPSVCNSVQQNITIQKLKRQIFC